MDHLRPARLEDTGELARLHAGGFDAPWSAKDFEALLETQGVSGIVAPGAGFALVRTAVDEAELLTIAVAPECRRQQLGAALLDAAIARAGEAGAAQMHLEVAVDNAAALRLYRRAGFAEAGRRRGYYERPGGQLDALVLTRVLHGPGA